MEHITKHDKILPYKSIGKIIGSVIEFFRSFNDFFMAL